MNNQNYVIHIEKEPKVHYRQVGKLFKTNRTGIRVWLLKNIAMVEDEIHNYLMLSNMGGKMNRR